MKHISSKTLRRRKLKIEQIRQKLSAGQTGKAIDRAKGLVSTFPFSAEVRVVTAEAYYAAGEHLLSGCYWYRFVSLSPFELAAIGSPALLHF